MSNRTLRSVDVLQNFAREPGSSGKYLPNGQNSGSAISFSRTKRRKMYSNPPHWVEASLDTGARGEGPSRGVELEFV